MTNKETFLAICKEDIKRDGINDLLKWLEDSDFFTAPASTRFHGNYEGGLCEHSLNVHRELTRLNDVYQLGYSKETIAITALFHDLCKVNYYKRGTRNVKDENGKGISSLSVLLVLCSYTQHASANLLLALQATRIPLAYDRSPTF